MTCTQMLERLIEADPDALAGRGNSDVALHVRECPRCRAVAEHLLAETQVLATVVERGAVVRRIRPLLIAPALAAAAVLAFVMLPDQPTAPTTVVTSQAPIVAAAPVAVSRSVPPAVASTPVPRRHVARAYPPATPVTVRPLYVASPEVSYQQVAVTPAPGKRAAVMRTSDPAITVIWVY